jgi:hypothetical protein
MSTKAKLITIGLVVAIASLGGIAANAKIMTPLCEEPAWGNDCIMSDLASMTNSSSLTINSSNITANSSRLTISDIAAARDFRDHVLATSSTGTKITSLYYTHSSEVFHTALLDSNYRNQLIANIRLIMPLVYRAEKQIYNIKSQRIQSQMDLPLTVGDIDGIERTLSLLNAHGSLALQQDIAAFRSSTGDLNKYIGVQAHVALEKATPNN